MIWPILHITVVTCKNKNEVKRICTLIYVKYQKIYLTFLRSDTNEVFVLTLLFRPVFLYSE